MNEEGLELSTFQNYTNITATRRLLTPSRPKKKKTRLVVCSTSKIYLSVDSIYSILQRSAWSRKFTKTGSIIRPHKKNSRKLNRNALQASKIYRSTPLLWPLQNTEMLKSESKLWINVILLKVQYRLTELSWLRQERIKSHLSWKSSKCSLRSKQRPRKYWTQKKRRRLFRFARVLRKF